jgi:1-acyl-sn-glycerol-3-phosphate acyltransferase
VKTILGIFGLIWKLYIAAVFVISAVFLYPVIATMLGNPNNKKMAFKMFVFWSWMFRFLCFYGVKKVKDSKLPEGPYLIVANHTSYLDIFLMYSFLSNEPFLFLGKSEILAYPLIKTYFKKMNIPVFRDNTRKAAKSLIQASREVKSGWSIMIFPEGGIPDDDNPKMIEFKQGAFRLAKSLKIPIVPISFTNNHKLFSDPTNILGPARPGISHVHIHEFITREEIELLSQEELSQKCFDIVNAPILIANPEVAKN